MKKIWNLAQEELLFSEKSIFSNTNEKLTHKKTPHKNEVYSFKENNLPPPY
jgi:hypothetical protein